LNNLDRYQLALDAISRIPRLREQKQTATDRYWIARNESEKPHDGKRVAPSTHVTKPVSEGSRAVASLAPSDKAC
jgi:hypothetical protein